MREGVDVKLLPQEQELYVLAQSHDRIHKERAMRRRKLKWLLARLKANAEMELNAEDLLLKLGAAKATLRGGVASDRHRAARSQSPARRHVQLRAQSAKAAPSAPARRPLSAAHQSVWQREPAELWQFYIQLVEVEAAFKNLKDDLQLRPIYHQLEQRIEAHIFVAFLAYCLHVTLRARCVALAPGLTPRAVLDKFAAIQMLDVHFPTTDGRTLILSRYTEPDTDQKILLEQLGLTLPPQPRPRITSKGALHH